MLKLLKRYFHFFFC